MEKEVIGPFVPDCHLAGGECLGDRGPYGAAAGHRGGSQLAAAGAGGRPSNGLKAARAIGILTYRNYGIMVQTQTDPDREKLDGFKASSYINTRGTSWRAVSCYSLLAADQGDGQSSVGAGRGGPGGGPAGDLAANVADWGDERYSLSGGGAAAFMAAHMPDAELVEIDSAYGHDGFMVEGNKIATLLGEWLRK
jgi:homoserine O-acetyltransferase